MCVYIYIYIYIYIYEHPREVTYVVKSMIPFFTVVICRIRGPASSAAAGGVQMGT